ncbi:MAG: Stk1 family PASTA domain-containing Ser/Thr kinase [Clostridiales bacterium]|nr:Stk1 family PASTA domain-containing Ser/Thr kinase [Clostridiales bacterium]
MSSRTLAGRYELLERIGDGGMAVVYKARDKLLNRYIAVKILKPEFTKDIKFIEIFRRESQAAAGLSHPNIVNIYDVGREGNINYIVMELIEGKALSDVIKEKGALKPREAVIIAKQIASALSRAHKNHIIHRDIKPHNILLTKDGNAKITDFGIAKAVKTGTIAGNTGMIMGSVHYFSPEQARGGYVDEKSDIYSLGIVLYEMLTGKVPFDADNPVAVAMKHIKEDIIPPSKLVPEIPAEVEEIVLKATSKIQINRYKTADEMVEALNNALPSTIGISSNPMIKEKPKQDQKTQSDKIEGEEDLRGKKKKRFKINKVKLAAIVLALILAFPASQLILTAIQAGSAPTEVEVIDVTGLDVEEATKRLNEIGLELEVGNEVVSDEYEEGLIVSQDPLPEMIVKTGKTVIVNVSKGPMDVTIPNVIGKTLSDAVFLIESFGYTKGGVSEEYSQMPKGVVIRQSPKAGTNADKGTSVSLVVSLGEEIKRTTVPNLIGLEVDEAKQAIENAGLSLGKISYAPSEIYAKNFVMDQSIRSGEEVELGTPISITVSEGIEQSVSKDINITIDYTDAVNEVFYLTVMVSDSTGVYTPINYEQRVKSNGSEVFTVTGSGKGSIKIYFDNALVKEYVVDFDTGEFI